MVIYFCNVILQNKLTFSQASSYRKTLILFFESLSTNLLLKYSSKISFVSCSTIPFFTDSGMISYTTILSVLPKSYDLSIHCCFAAKAEFVINIKKNNNIKHLRTLNTTKYFIYTNSNLLQFYFISIPP